MGQTGGGFNLIFLEIYPTRGVSYTREIAVGLVPAYFSVYTSAFRDGLGVLGGLPGVFGVCFYLPGVPKKNRVPKRSFGMVQLPCHVLLRSQYTSGDFSVADTEYDRVRRALDEESRSGRVAFLKTLCIGT